MRFCRFVDKRRFIWALLLLSTAKPALAQLDVRISPREIAHYEVGRINIGDRLGRPVKVRYLGVTRDDDQNDRSEEPRIDHPYNYLMLNQTEWTTPGYIEFMVNPLRVVTSYGSLRVVFETVGEQPPRRVSDVVSHVARGNVRPVIQSVVNAYSQQPVLTPGALVTIYSFRTLSLAPLTGQYDNLSRYPADLMQYSVRINGVAAPILSVAADRINVIAPYEIAASASAEVLLSVPRKQGQAIGDNISFPFVVPVRDTAPGIRTLHSGGSGLVDARQIVKGIWEWSQHGPENPVPRGAAMELFVTGAGLWASKLNGDVAYGDVRLPPPMSLTPPLAFTGQPVSVTIGGVSAEVLYVGATLLRPWGLLQVNVVVPGSIGSGPQQVVVRIGSNDNAAQRATIQIE